MSGRDYPSGVAFVSQLVVTLRKAAKLAVTGEIIRMFLPLLLSMSAAATGAAADTPRTTASQISALTACRAITDAQARLACYDSAATSLEQAIASRELTVLNKSDVRQTRKSLFGFSFPKIPFLGGGGDDDAESKEITAKIASLRSSGYGKWQFRLDDGALWETTEPMDDGVSPAAGENVTIRRGALTNYFIHFPGIRPVRGRRVS